MFKFKWVHLNLHVSSCPLPTSLLLLAVLDDTRRVHKRDPLQEFDWHLNAYQLLQKALAELLQGREGPRAVSCHDDSLDAAHFLSVHEDRVLRGGGLSS